MKSALVVQPAGYKSMNKLLCIILVYEWSYLLYIPEVKESRFGPFIQFKFESRITQRLVSSGISQVFKPPRFIVSISLLDLGPQSRTSVLSF